MKKLSILGTILALILLCSACSSSSSTSSSATGSTSTAAKDKKTTASTQKSDAATTDKAKKKSTDPSKVTAKEFKQIENGMTYKDVVKIVGSKGKLMSESGKKGTDAHTAMYSWDGAGDLGANVSLTFQGGKLVNKSQFGLSDGTDSKVTITMKEFSQIQNGMTYKDVQKIVGGKGSVQGVTGKKGSDYYTRTISYKGKSIGANAMLTFQDGKLENKSQFGLK